MENDSSQSHVSRNHFRSLLTQFLKKTAHRYMDRVCRAAEFLIISLQLKRFHKRALEKVMFGNASHDRIEMRCTEINGLGLFTRIA